MTFSDDLSTVLRYLTEKDSDFYPSLVGPFEQTPHLMFADFLKGKGEDELADRIHRQTELSNNVGGRPLPASWLHTESGKDRTLHAVRTGHPNPTVRALSGRVNDGPDHRLFDVLFHSPYDADHDIAVYLSPEDGPKTHSSHKQVSAINKAGYNEGLEAKVVRGTVYLIDHDTLDPHGYESPSILFTAPVNDHSELKAMEDHARAIAEQRAAVGPAVVGPAH